MANLRDSEIENIIFFDGVCSLCNGFIDFLIKRDTHRRLRYAPLQGFTATERLPMTRVKIAKSDGPSFSSVVYLKNGVMLSQSAAVIEILSDLGGMWRLVSVLKFIPGSIRDAGYTFIATRRYKWFGKREACRVPTKQERSLFLS